MTRTLSLLAALFLSSMAHAAIAAAAPQDNRITGLSLSRMTAAAGDTVRVTVSGTGSCLARIDNGGAQTVAGKTYTDIAGTFPKFHSIVVSGPPGTYSISGGNANSRDAPCAGGASATLVVTGAPTTSTTSTTVSSTSSTTIKVASNALMLAPVKLATTTATTTTTTSSNSKALRMATPPTAPTTAPTTPTTALADPCKLSAREQAAQGVRCTTTAATTTTTLSAGSAGMPCKKSTDRSSSGAGCSTAETTPPRGQPSTTLASPSQSNRMMGGTTTTLPPAAYGGDPCTLSEREQAARGVYCASAPAAPSGRSFAAVPVSSDGANPVPVSTPPGPTSSTPPANSGRPSADPEKIVSPASAKINTTLVVDKTAAPAAPDTSPAPDMLAPAGAGKTEAAKKPEDAFEPGQLLVLWDEKSDAIAGLNILAAEYGLRPLQRVELPNLGGMLASFQLRDHKQALSVRDLLRQRYPTWHVDLHVRYQSLAGPRIYLPSKIDAPAKSAPLPNLRIGMLDTGVTQIRALQDVKLTQRSFLAVSDVATSTAHGTAIASLIAGQDKANGFQALAPGAQLFAGGIMRDQLGRSGTNTATLLQGLDWLRGNNVQLINLSLGGPGDELMAGVFLKLQRQGVIVVASGGNAGPDASPSYPAAYPGVLAVTAVDALDQPYRDANQGKYIAIAAPGVDVWTPDAANGHYVTGTSFSSAVVTGAIGLMLSRRADLTPDAVRENLCRSARDLGAPGQDAVFGCGVMQIGRTLAGLKGDTALAGAR